MIAAIIPTLDEADAIGAVLDAVPDAVDGEEVRVYVIDGGSTDDTVAIAEDRGAEVLVQSYSGGKGSAMREAVDRIDADVYVFLDGDGTYDPAELPRLARPVLEGTADHVIGTRLEDREAGALSWFNLAGNLLFNRLTSWIYGREIRDMLSGYRAVDGEHMRSMPLLRRGFGIETEMTVRTVDSDARLDQVPITYSARMGDAGSKLHPVRDGARILTTILRMGRDTRPLRMFSLLSLLFLLLAAYPAFVTVRQKLVTGVIPYTAPAVLTALLVIMAVQTFLAGLLADQQRTGFRRIERRLQRSGS